VNISYDIEKANDNTASQRDYRLADQEGGLQGVERYRRRIIFKIVATGNSIIWWSIEKNYFLVYTKIGYPGVCKNKAAMEPKR